MKLRNLLRIMLILVIFASCQVNDILDAPIKGSIQTESAPATVNKTHFVDEPVKYLAEVNYGQRSVT